jgi:cell wall-associated NlpC family hydrolase
MPRRSQRRRLVPLLTLMACALPCAGATAAPVPDAAQVRAERAAKLETVHALVERKEDRRARATAGAAVVKAVRAQIGDPYAYGGSGPDGFDCSGLTRHAFARTGVELPHNSHAQAERGRAVDREDIRRGDLVFFSTAGPGASHVGIAVGGSTVVSATSSGGVMEHSIDDEYWGAHYVTARRVS